MSVATSGWLPAPERFQLAPHEVHVWCASLNLPARHTGQLWPLLAPDEQARAERFHFEQHRQRFIAGRGILRTLLGRYLNRAPAQLRFSYNSYGKPALATPHVPSFQFNVSHSADMALYAVAHGRLIGVDIEHVRPVEDIEQIVTRFFSPQEQAEWQRLPPEQRVSGFFNGWTRKEAYIKAQGQGLSLPLDQFDVSLSPGAPARLLADRKSQNVADWTLIPLAPTPDYIGALIFTGPAYELKCWRWPEMVGS